MGSTVTWLHAVRSAQAKRWIKMKLSDSKYPIPKYTKSLDLEHSLEHKN
jgi:hypothetical protein